MVGDHSASRPPRLSACDGGWRTGFENKRATQPAARRGNAIACARRNTQVLAHTKRGRAKAHIGGRFFDCFTGKAPVVADEAFNRRFSTYALRLRRRRIEDSGRSLRLSGTGSGHDEES